MLALGTRLRERGGSVTPEIFRVHSRAKRGVCKDDRTHSRESRREIRSGEELTAETDLRHIIRKKLRNYPCTSVRTTCVGSFASICSSGKHSESYRSNHPLTEASKATDASPILPTQPPTLPTQPPTLPTQPPPYGS